MDQKTRTMASTQAESRGGERARGPASEARYRELYEHAPDILYTHDLDGRLTSINATAERLLGYTHSDARRLTIHDIVSSEHRRALQDHIDMLRTGTSVAPLAIDFASRDGGRVAVEVALRLVTADGQPIEVHGCARPVSPRRESDPSVRESDQRLRAVVGASVDAIVVIDATGVIRYSSPATTQVLGYAVDDFVGQNAFALIHPEDRGRVEQLFARCLQEPGTQVMAEYRFRHQDGSWRYVEGLGSNRLDDPLLRAVVVNLRDVSDRKRMDEARRASEEQFRTIFEGAPIGIARLDLEGRVVDANRALERMSGYVISELRGRQFTDLVAGDDVELARADLASLLAGRREAYHAERRYTQKGGTAVWANVTVSVVRDAAGQPQFCIGMVEDITDRKNAEEALRKSNKRLTGWVAELEQRTREIGLLSEMGDLLQACRSAEEAHAVIARMAPQVFPNVAGSVSVLGVANNLVETVAVWGPPTGERVFGPDECWALRRGRAHLVEDIQLGLICKHMHRPLSLPYVCVPMLAHGEAVGLLNLNLPEEGRVSDALQRLGMTVAEHVALALANLRLHETLRAQSIRDPLTNLFNRRYMEESLEREMRRAVRGRHSVGIIMLDLDHFKRVNDEYGHEAGDTVLRELGAVLQRNIRGEDIACRYGGEEFTLILPEASLADAAQRAEQLRGAIKSLPIRYRKQSIGPITVSLGVAVFPDHGPTGEAVLRAADAALYQAKGRGRDRVMINAGASGTAETIVDFSGG